MTTALIAVVVLVGAIAIWLAYRRYVHTGWRDTVALDLAKALNRAAREDLSRYRDHFRDLIGRDFSAHHQAELFLDFLSVYTAILARSAARTLQPQDAEAFLSRVSAAVAGIAAGVAPQRLRGELRPPAEATSLHSQLQDRLRTWAQFERVRASSDSEQPAGTLAWEFGRHLATNLAAGDEVASSKLHLLAATTVSAFDESWDFGEILRVAGGGGGGLGLRAA